MSTPRPDFVLPRYLPGLAGNPDTVRMYEKELGCVVDTIVDNVEQAVRLAFGSVVDDDRVEECFSILRRKAPPAVSPMFELALYWALWGRLSARERDDRDADRA